MPTRLFLLPILLAFSTAMSAQIPLTRISVDPFTNSSSQHATEVEVSTFASGNTIVSAFQQGRFNLNGGSTDNGFATSQDGGLTWHHGSLPGLTVIGGGGSFDRATDPAVAFDAAHNVWLIASLPLLNNGGATTAELISRSSDGLTWQKPVAVSPNFPKPDKTWLSCDNNTASPFFGHCYAEWDDNSQGDIVYLAVSSDGGQTWGSPVQPAGGPAVFGAQPLAQPNGTVVAPGSDAFNTSILSFTSKDGGKTWSSPVTVTSITAHGAAGGLRDLILPTSAVDASGKVYTVWQDCRFRSNCAENDLVMSTSTDGTHWSAVTRIPIDAVNSTVDHFIPGLAIEPGTSGATAHLGLTYYFYPQTNCTSTTCNLNAGYISSRDGGKTWTKAARLAGPMNLTWLPNTSSGLMVGDYESLAFVNGKAHPVFPLARPNNGSKFSVAMDATSTGLEEGSGVSTSESESPVPEAHSDRPPRTTPACDRCDED